MSALSDYFVLVDGPKKYRGQNLQTGTTYELVLEDAGKIIEMNNASANTVNIPANSAVAFPVDTRIDVIQYGVGQTTITITTDTLSSGGAIGSSGSFFDADGTEYPASGTAAIASRYGVARLWKRSATEWVIT